MDYRWDRARFKHVVRFKDADEALRFVMQWRFGYAGPNRYDFQVLRRWGLPTPSSAPDNIDLDRALEEVLMEVTTRTEKVDGKAGPPDGA